MFFHVQKRKLETLMCFQASWRPASTVLLSFSAGSPKFVYLKVQEIHLKSQKEPNVVQKTSKYVCQPYINFAEGCEL